MTTSRMMNIVQAQLAIDMNCTIDDFHKERGCFVFTEAKDNPGRRPFPKKEPMFEMLSMGNAIIVSAAPHLLDIVKPMLNGKNHNEAFSMPFVRGQSLFYLPDLLAVNKLAAPEGFIYAVVEQSDIPALYRYKEGFPNALAYDINHPRPDKLAIIAKQNNAIVGMAGASADCENMWQIGIDVLSSHRNHGLAARLVNQLTTEILSRGYIPYYGTKTSNIASQRVAHRAGFFPAWISVYESKFDK